MARNYYGKQGGQGTKFHHDLTVLPHGEFRLVRYYDLPRYMYISISTISSWCHIYHKTLSYLNILISRLGGRYHVHNICQYHLISTINHDESPDIPMETHQKSAPAGPHGQALLSAGTGSAVALAVRQGHVWGVRWPFQKGKRRINISG